MASTSQNNEQEREWLLLIAEGDEQAFRKIFHQYADTLHKNIYAIIQSHSASKDLVQDCFVRVWLHRDKLPEIENFRHWLLRIGYNRAFSHLREKTTREKGAERHAEKYGLTERDNETDEQLQLLTLRKIIAETVQGLPPQQKKIYLLSREHGMKLPEIAEYTGLSLSTVKNTLGRALQALRLAIEETGDGLLVFMFLLHG